MKTSMKRVRSLLRRLAPESEPQHEVPGESLLARISLVPPAPPIGRSGAAYVYDPTRAPPMPVAYAACRYEVSETFRGHRTVRHSSPSLLGATDYALELHVVSGGRDVEVVRVEGDERQSVLRFTRESPPEGADSALALLELFGLPDAGR
jgi:hypothetical protein